MTHKIYAYCFASGEIEMGSAVPDGAIWVAYGCHSALTGLIEGTARLAHDNATWLIPGVPEAENQTIASNALAAYLSWIGKRKLRGITINQRKRQEHANA